ncbi:DUF305 domain-containing protein [Micromonospora sp. NBC_01813]|uniref:DUF305 domain-containing protein n=1 Tax=Micromonospora sp. NBC_01813 TaxID=2975988 RepID=UPI002DDBE372|nr:DUF305 domain-containing protein [Micromonospora sp. NBC_01813]WSA06772.1 DUF305 domain-containing protein [Micromonospora sp. NBC_01813]
MPFVRNDGRARFAAVVSAAAMSAGLVGGCGGAGEAVPPTASAPAESVAVHTPNGTDVAFARDMIPHHRQAMEMADLAVDRAGSAEVRTLADQIRQAQDSEITQMAGWLTEWGQPLPSPGQHTGQDEHHGMPGMMTGAEMAALAGAAGADFDRLFLDMMIRHHEGAVRMAGILRSDGVHPAVRQLAESIAASQQSEITEMRGLLEQL